MARPRSLDIAAAAPPSVVDAIADNLETRFATKAELEALRRELKHEIGTTEEVIGWPDVQRLTGKMSRSTIDRLERAGQFPRRRQLSAHRIGWSTAEIRAWRESRTRGRFPGREHRRDGTRG